MKDGMQGRKRSNLTLVKKPESKKNRVLLLLVFILAVFGTGIYFLVTDFSIKNIEISGNDTYTEYELMDAMKKDGYVGNTLLMIVENQLFGQTYLPFVEKVTMSYDDTHVLKVKVKEKLRAGVFQYGDKYVYFNEEGIALESRNTLFSGVPVVTGVEFSKMKLKKKIPAKDNYFRTIVAITKKIAAWELDISEIHFDGEDDITLYSSKYKIYLGSSAYLDGKMSRISSILDAVSKKHKKGTIDMHLYTDEKPVITYKK